MRRQTKERAMRHFRTSALAAATTATLALAGVATTGPASAGDPAVGKQVLDLLCQVKDGTPYFSPYTIARCQEARDTRGFVLEELVCEGLLEGTFTSVPTVGRPNRANWFCFTGITGA
jgi:hypothetical protein